MSSQALVLYCVCMCMCEFGFILCVYEWIASSGWPVYECSTYKIGFNVYSFYFFYWSLIVLSRCEKCTGHLNFRLLFSVFFLCFFLGSSLTTLPVAGRLDYVKAWLLTSVLCCKREVSLICFGIMRSPFSLATLCLSTAFVLLSYLQSFSPWNAPPSVPKYILLVIWLLGKCWWTELYYGFFFFFLCQWLSFCTVRFKKI